MTIAPSPTTVYPSTRDWWIEILLLAAVVGMAAAALAAWATPEPLAARVAISLVTVLMAGFVLWVLYGTTYTLTPERLIVRSGPLRWTVPLAVIEEVRPTRNPLSAPALSLDRLHIRRNDARGVLLISPETQAEFLRDLAGRAPELVLEGDRLVRRPGTPKRG